MNTVLAQRPARLPLTRACHALGLNRSTVYAHQKRAANDEPPRRSRKQSVQPRALSAQERAAVVKTLHSERRGGSSLAARFWCANFFQVFCSNR